MKPPYQLSDEELKEYAEFHLQYELEMLTWSAQILASLGVRKNDKPISWTLSNGTLNTFAIHARNLIDFLYSRTKKKDRQTDIIIQDYVDASEVSLHLIDITPLLEKALRKADKQVAHLTMERIDYEKSIKEKEWGFIEVMNHIRSAFASIAPFIPDQKMSKNLRDKLSQKSVAIQGVESRTTFSQNSQENGICLSIKHGE